MADLWCDLETFSEIPIKHGSYKYAEGAEVLLFQYALDYGPVSVWDVASGEPCPLDLEMHLTRAENLVWFQNGTKFDWVVLAVAMPWACEAVPLDRRRDTMVQAYSHSLPGGLEMMCRALGVEQDKRKTDGKALIRLFCMLPPKNVNDRSRRTAQTHPAEWERFRVYACQDIVAMRECHRKMPMWNYKGKQLLLEQFDARCNARGICVDVELAEAAIRASTIAKKGLAEDTQEMTDGEVQAATQRDAMLAHILARYGVDLPDMQKDTIERRALDESLPWALRELLRVRLESTTTSVAKFGTLVRGVNRDGRLRGTMQFRGAQRTGRVAHRLFQPGNMPRPTMKWKEIYWAIELIKLDAVHLVYRNAMKACSNAIRGTIIAPPGKKLVVADLANIEGRFAAWLAGEDWKLQAFRDYDAGIGADLYIIAYASSFNVAPGSIDKSTIEGYNQRQIGKVQELMFQYGGGVGAWITGAATYGIDLVKMTEQVYDTLPAWARDEAAQYLAYLYSEFEAKHAAALVKLKTRAELGPDAPDFVPMPTVEQWAQEMLDEEKSLDSWLDGKKSTARMMLSEKTFITCDAIKRLWRRAHPQISSYWKEIENALEYVILNPGETLQCRRVKVRRDGEWLRCALPSGRALCYPSPRLNHVDTDLATGKKKHYPGISYLGIDQYTKKWQRISTYGGKVFENWTQAGSCDQLLETGPAIEAAGFEPVLSVHDEWITEAPADRDDLNDELLSEMMCADLGWNEGLPLAAAGYTSLRYRKDD